MNDFTDLVILVLALAVGIVGGFALIVSTVLFVLNLVFGKPDTTTTDDTDGEYWSTCDPAHRPDTHYRPDC